jgi:hypothetical protein
LFDATIRHLAAVSVAACVDHERSSHPVVVSGFADTTGDVMLKVTAGDGAILSYQSEFIFPFSTWSTFTFADTVGDVASSVGARTLWNEASTPEQLHFALMVAVTDLLRAKGLSHRPEDVPEFSIGSDFFETALRYGAAGSWGTNRDLLREACARIVVNDPKYPIGELRRANKVGKLVPISRHSDGALACRTHLQKSHAALRLMFWRRKDGSAEFANVGPKAELEILDGTNEPTERHDCWRQKQKEE